MAAVSRQTPRSFSRGSAVLEYWLVHAEGLVVQPSGARVEHVVLAQPVGRAEALIVRSRMTGRRRTIPAGAVAAVEPAAGRLLLEPRTGRRSRVFSPERIAAVRAALDRGGRLARAGFDSASTWTRAALVAALLWLRPRAAKGGTTIARAARRAALATGDGARRLAPRVAAEARAAGEVTGRATVEVTSTLTRGVVRTAQHGRRATVSAAARAKTSLEARNARREDASRSDRLSGPRSRR